LPKITPFLWFDTQAEEAARFYVSVFPNSKITGTTPGPTGGVMTVSFELDGQPFIGLNGGPHFKFSEAVSFSIECKSQAEIDGYWSRLTEGGQESQCGWLKDRFGLSWQVVPANMGRLLGPPDPAKAQRAVAAMMKMKKLDIAALENA